MEIGYLFGYITNFGYSCNFLSKQRVLKYIAIISSNVLVITEL